MTSKSSRLAFGFVAVLIFCMGAAAPTEKQKLAQAIKNFLTDEPDTYEQLVAFGEPAVEGLVTIFQDYRIDPPMRWKAINALGDIGSTKAVRPLLAALNHNDFNIRRSAAAALGRIGDESARLPLTRLAKEDRHTWVDESGKTRYLVRESAQFGLRFLDARAAEKKAAKREVFLDDASKPPPSPVKVPIRRLSWPFPGGFREQFIFNNYQQPTDVYVHAALDFIQAAGKEVRAVEDGFMAAMGTNYPDWKTHNYYFVATKKGGDEGWCYTHMDPDSVSLKVGDPVRAGQVIGKVVDFYVGSSKGADHLHLQYVRVSKKPSGGENMHGLVDPLLFFDWEDKIAPTIDAKLHFVRAGTLDEFESGEGGVSTVSGKVDIIAGMTDSALADLPCNWGVPVITVEIKGEGISPWRKLVLDQRGAIEDSRPSAVLYLTQKQSEKWMQGRPRYPNVHFVRLTRTDGNGIIEIADLRYCWDTEKNPDGIYDVTVRAWDLKENLATRTVKVRVLNKAAR